MVLGMSGPPGACAPQHVAAVTVTVPVPASSPRMEDSLAVAPQDKPSSATSLSALVRSISIYYFEKIQIFPLEPC